MNLKKSLVLLLVSCLLVSLILCLGVFAEDETPDAAATPETTENAETTENTENTETTDTTGTTDAAPATGAADTAEVATPAAAEETKKMSVGSIVSLSIGGALILGVIIFCIIKRKKVAEGWRSYRSEMKKITWYPWKQVWRGTVFVIVTVLITAFVIGVLDIAFFEGQYLLTGKGLHFFGAQ